VVNRFYRFFLQVLLWPHLKIILIFIFPKVIQQLNFKIRLKVSPFTSLPLNIWGYFWSIFKMCLVLIVLEVNSYSNNRDMGWFTIIFPPISMLLIWFYMHDTR
jgi:hypothetical protein